jgi:shikimate dehydrogenase
MKIGGQTKKFAVLGHPIGHTLSPVMHNAAIQALGWDAIYLAFDVHPDHLMDVLPSMQKMGFGGVNLTVPLKEVAFKGLSKLDESAQLMGAVNTVKFETEGPKGFNTDGMGFLKAVEESFGAPLAGKRMFVMGTGGAGRAVALAAAGAGITSIALADLDVDRCRKLAVELETQFFIQEIDLATTPSSQIEAALEADLVVQSTPIGMKATDPSPLPAEAFREGHWAFDLIYMYPETAFMKTAKAGGAKTANGLGMLLHQGAKAFEIWTGTQPPTDVMRAALEKEVYKE